MTIRKHVVAALTDGAGAATVYSPYLSGFLEAIQYVKTDFTNGVDFTITSEATGETIWTQLNVDAAVTVRPRGATHSVAGVASLYAAAGEFVGERIALGRDRIKIVIAAGGAAHTGTFNIFVNDA